MPVFASRTPGLTRARGLRYGRAGSITKDTISDGDKFRSTSPLTHVCALEGTARTGVTAGPARGRASRARDLMRRRGERRRRQFFVEERPFARPGFAAP